jgi:DNA-binding MarR family transcriptional regulator
VSDVTPAFDPTVTAVDRSLDLLRRKLTPRGMRRISDTHECHAEGVAAMGSHTMPLLAAIAADGDEVTVGAIADTMCVDPSRASRMITGAIEAGHVRRLASQKDGRRTVLELTDEGREVLARAGKFWQGQYERAMAGWSQQERAEFARLLTRFCDGLSESA